jgi:hypothetical protein
MLNSDMRVCWSRRVGLLAPTPRVWQACLTLAPGVWQLYYSIVSDTKISKWIIFFIPIFQYKIYSIKKNLTSTYISSKKKKTFSKNDHIIMFFQYTITWILLNNIKKINRKNFVPFSFWYNFTLTVSFSPLYHESRCAITILSFVYFSRYNLSWGVFDFPLF